MSSIVLSVLAMRTVISLQYVGTGGVADERGRRNSRD